MKIQKLRLQNFRCFEETTINFSDQFNVLIGDNGSGKTAVLDALAMALGVFTTYFARTYNEQQQKRTITADDASRKQYLKGQTVTIEPQYPVIVRCRTIWKDVLVDWDVQKTAPVINAAEKKLSQNNLENIAQQLRENVQTGGDELLPLMAYYSVSRLQWGNQKTETINWAKQGSRTEGYAHCWHPISNRESLLAWLKTQEAVSLQKGQADGIHHAVKNAIASCLDIWGKIIFDFSEDDLLVMKTDGLLTLPYRMLSDGVRNMLAIVADIAYRSAVLNPQWEAAAIQETPGIVLIDEIDLHLHPKWQRRVIEDLRRTFPKIQFIVTTHSPFILQSAQPGEVIDLNRSEFNFRPTDKYTDASIDDIVENVQGVPIPQMSYREQQMLKAAEEYYQVLQQAKQASPKEVEQLKQKLDELATPFSDNVAYHAFLKMERAAAGLGNNGV